MEPPYPPKSDFKQKGYSLCIACRNWTENNNLFDHEGRYWILCTICYVDYWENTDELLPDYKGYFV